ncbi:MAG: PAS domain S-box protein [Deltaproteobacteria bacterium]|nr:PAS domain S-box protein [Deltaproteobacteria bacterium]
MSENKTHLLNHLPVGVIEFSLTHNSHHALTDFKIIYSNPQFQKISGHTESELNDLTMKDLFSPVNQDKFEWGELLTTVSFSGENQEFEKFFKSIHSWFSIAVSFIETDRMLITIMDISLHKHRSSEQQAYLSLTDNITASTDYTGTFRFINRRWAPVLGWTAGSIIHNNFLDFVHIEDRISVKKAIESASANSDAKTFLCRMKHKSGTFRWIEWRVKSVQFYLHYTGRDVTPIKTSRELNTIQEKELSLAIKRQEVLSEFSLEFTSDRDFSDKMPRALALVGNHLNLSRVYVFEDDEGGETTSNTFEWCNTDIEPQMETLQNVPYELIPSYRKILHEHGYIYSKNIDELPVDLRNILEPQGIKSILIFPLVRNGQIVGFTGFDECLYYRKWSKSEFELIRTLTGIITNVITHNKHLKELKKSEENFRMMFETIEDLLVIGNSKGDIIHCNSSVSSELGYSFDELMKMKTSDLIPDNWKDQYQISMDEVFTGRRDHFVIPFLKSDGTQYSTKTQVWLGFWNGDISIFQLSDTGSKITITKETDVNRVIKIEHDLYIQDIKLKNIIEASEAGTWEWNIKTGEITVNKRWKEIIGFEEDEMKEIDIKTWLSLVHKEDLKKSNLNLKNHFDGKSKYYKCNCRIRHKDGHYIRVLNHGMVISRNLDGTPSFMSGINLVLSS